MQENGSDVHKYIASKNAKKQLADVDRTISQSRGQLQSKSSSFSFDKGARSYEMNKLTSTMLTDHWLKSIVKESNRNNNKALPNTKRDIVGGLPRLLSSPLYQSKLKLVIIPTDNLLYKNREVFMMTNSDERIKMQQAID